MTHLATVSSPPLPRQYGDELLVFEHGEGCRLFDRIGRSYLDMGAGIAVNALGYGRTDLAEIAAEQMRRLTHVSNLFATGPQLELAARMISMDTPGQSHARFEAVHFGNSGAEANETALKYARLHARSRHGEGKTRIIAFEKGFHGRTMGALSVTATEAYRRPFGPLVPDIEFLPLNSIPRLEDVMSEDVAAVIVEPIQGEGGLNILSGDFSRRLNSLCRRYDALLIADEVQTGLGRCGTFYASALVGLEPDIITLAKPLAGGLPLSAVLVPSAVNALLSPGHHATTFGGGPVTTAVALAVWDILSKPEFLAETRRKGELCEELMAEGLKELEPEGEILGAGLLKGLRINAPGADASWCASIIAECRNQGLIILKTGSNALRLAPPLVITNQELTEGLNILFRVISQNLPTGAKG